MILIEQSWSELFLLLSIQYSIEFDIFKQIFGRFKQLNINLMEFECLKTIILYRFGKKKNFPNNKYFRFVILDNRTLKQIEIIENLQDQALITLAQFQNPTRYLFFVFYAFFLNSNSFFFLVSVDYC